MSKLTRRFRPRLSRGVVVIAIVAVAAAALAGTVLADPGALGNPWPYNAPVTPAASAAPVLAAVGDISCQPGDKQGTEKPSDVCTGGVTPTTRNAAQNATAMQVESMNPTLVAVLGDEQYQNGYYSDFENSFDKYWGAFKFLQRPSPENHEFYDNHGQLGVRGLGYFDYYNGFAHNAADGSEIDTTLPNGVVQPTPLPDGQAGDFGQTGDGWYSVQPRPVAPDLAQHRMCRRAGRLLPGRLAHARLVAYWHQPTFSSTHDPSTGDSAEG